MQASVGSEGLPYLPHFREPLIAQARRTHQRTGQPGQSCRPSSSALSVIWFAATLNISISCFLRRNASQYSFDLLLTWKWSALFPITRWNYLFSALPKCSKTRYTVKGSNAFLWVWFPYSVADSASYIVLATLKADSVYIYCILGEGHGSPLQCSRLENPRDGGAWWAAVYGVAQSWTRLRRLSSSIAFIKCHTQTLALGLQWWTKLITISVLMETPCQGKSIAKLIFLSTLNSYILPAYFNFSSGLLIFVQVLGLSIHKQSQGIVNERRSSKWQI